MRILSVGLVRARDDSCNNAHLHGREPDVGLFAEYKILWILNDEPHHDTEDRQEQQDANSNGGDLPRFRQPEQCPGSEKEALDD